MKKLNKEIRKTRGFTMIELIIVIAVLGILAAFALPRFANFTTKAQTSAKESIVGSLNASLGIVKSKYIADGSTGTSVTLDGGTAIAVTNTGDLDMTAVTTNAACTTLVSALLSSRSGISVSVGTTAGTCTVTGNGYTVTLASTGAN